ncbi:protein DpdJ [Hyalangium gracile]|uniref:protein DpdJ n=1 Tax=Hyalangium gracile TaxID=394092 RepID=UPI001CCA82CD|nr:protein DpdJ [Hyalangium gracile]
MTFELLRDFLDTLEREEARQLSWGLCDGGFSDDEVRQFAADFLSERDEQVAAGQLCEELIERGLLFEFHIAGRSLYRTRMAETTRLMARLRQLFPKKRWENAPTLVSDYRFALRPRRYPARHIQPAEALNRMRPEVRLPATGWQAFEALLNAGGKPLHLADFQLRATQRMLGDLEESRPRGMIVCAGTGTGKTLAFYLPALSYLAGLIRPGQYFTKALAVYPRTELLKDQLSETFLQARRLDGVLPAGRKLIVAAFSGLTPQQASADSLRSNKAWVERSGSFACPVLRCPVCEGVLQWRKEDLAAGRERLRCESPDCPGKVEEDEIVLTRDRLVHVPPDILFTTTEMLNRQLSSSQFGHLFGLGTSYRPRIVLLDEVHTYHGVHGAQVAHVLRRYRHALGSPLHFTGLSATLRDATDFFSRLVGLPPSSVEEISPSGPMVEEGMEYQLALRGDPASGTSLLSTSIQTAMLLRRTLDPQNGLSEGAYGKRVYCFTDDLDVTNRLYHDLRSAEGYGPFGRHIKEPLAALRVPPESPNFSQFQAGQAWVLPQELGHDLKHPLQISRTSSQDVGVDRDSDVVVATASLEVGYNDPEVGAVMQHKAPRDVASFLQRKGRAGRRRTMRPWTVVVLSDYGRDRLAYQGYDQLFDPQLEGRSLPTLNRHVLRMQATYALMDWVATKLPANAGRGSVWYDFTKPASDRYLPAVQRQQLEARLLEELLTEEGLRRELESYLSKALQIPPEEVIAVLWEPPRALLASVVPTMLRRLRSKWARLQVQAGEGSQDLQARNAPLPDFVPENLFSDLNLPEVTIINPPETSRDEEGKDVMPIVQAMRVLTPGNVTRRFAISRGDIKHWIPPPNLVDENQDMPVTSWCAEFEEAGIFQMIQDGKVVPVRCIRPWVLKTQVTERAVQASSRGTLEWRSQIFSEDDGVAIRPPAGTPWARLFEDVRYFTHNLDSRIHVRRFAIGCEAELKVQYEERCLSLRFCESPGGPPAAVGFVKDVDGIRFRFRMPENLRMEAGAGSERKLRAFRSAYFRHRVQQDELLGSLANTFQLDWLGQVYLAALVTQASGAQSTLKEAAAELREAELDEELSSVLDVIFQVVDVEAQEDAEPAGKARVHKNIEELCRNPEVQARLHELARSLWEPPDGGWHRWAQERFCATLGGALLEACQRLCPQFDAGDLTLDLDPGPSPQGALPSEEWREIWITEDSMGGGGIVEEILRRTAEDPRLFYLLAESALAPSDFELVDSELTRLLKLLETEQELSDALAEVRGAYGMRSLSRAAEHLRAVMASRGLLTSHSVICALHARVLRPGSSQETDEVLRVLLRLWEQEEARLGIEIEARPFAFVASQDEALAAGFTSVGQGMHEEASWRYQAIYGLLWPRGSIIRARALSSYNPFASLPEADREIVLDCIGPTERTIELSSQDWRNQVQTTLAEGGSVRLVAAEAERDALKSALLQLVADPIEVGFLHLFPRVEAVVRELTGFSVKLRCPEVIP